MTSQEIVVAIDSHFRESNYNYNMWYVGITSDIDSRLFGDHKVPNKDHWFIYRQADSAAIARQVESHFLKLGMDGGTGGGVISSRYIYVYLKTSITNP